MKQILFILIFFYVAWPIGMHALLIPSSATALSLSQAGIASSYDESINSAYQINSKNPKYFSFGMNNWYGDLKGTKIQYRWLNKSSNSIKVNLWEITDLELRDTIPSVLPLGEFGAQFSSINYNFSNKLNDYNYGINLGLHYLGLFTESGVGVTCDLGIQRSFFDWLDMGLSVRNLGFFNHSLESDLKIPITSGIGIQVPLRKIKTKFLFDYNNDSFHGSIIRSGMQWSNSKFKFRLGISKSQDYYDSSLGIGFSGNKWGLNYSILSNSEQNLGLPQFIEIIFYPKF